MHDTGASSFLYPFLAEREDDLDAVLADVRASALAKSAEVGALRAQTLSDAREPLTAAADALRACFEAGGKLLALGNGGSATDAMDAVADLREPPAGRAWPARPALDLTEDPAILTAIANDIGTEAIFARQIIAYADPGDAVLALSTSGGSGNVLAALAEARGRKLVTIAFVGYDGGRIAGEALADHVVVSRSEHIRASMRGRPAPGTPCVSSSRPRADRDGALRRRDSPPGGIRVAGVVQGVGSRPYVHRLASELGLSGFVCNDARGVVIEAEGPAEDVERFVARLRAEAPPLARVEAVSASALEPAGDAAFVIAASRAGPPAAAVTPDGATCDACLAEVLDPADRRFRYPFTNCTNCGPRFTIIRGVPYDRPQTTMAAFAMCARCRAEYEDPLDRRFHAQPNACPDCGPRARLVDAAGREAPDARAVDAVHAAALALRAGLVVAVKGMGGYHLACLADDERAVAALRRRKRREEKPFALMARDIDAARRLVALTPEAERALSGVERPIVLAPRRAGAPVAAEVAPRSAELGVMLPYTPLHHLLLADAGGALVMTSGNVSDEPIAFRDEDALERLAGIADRFLVHDRPIHTRADDSVVRVVHGATVPLRRSRGYVPASIALRIPAPRPLLACGAELKSTFCLAKGARAWVGPHVGDLTNFETLRSFEDGVAHMARLFDVVPEVVAHDLHPDYRSTAYAQRLDGVELVGVQHHHAHLAACLAEHGESGPAVGAILDGTGFGTDGTVWGASCSPAVSTASSGPATCGRCACRAATARCASRGGWRARGCGRRSATTRIRRPCCGIVCRSPRGARSRRSRARASPRPSPRAPGGCSTRWRRCAADRSA